MLTFTCRDVGFNCGFSAKADMEKEMWDKIAAHAQQRHGLKPEDIPQDMKSKIHANIHKSPS